MKAIVSAVLSQEKAVCHAVSAYIDDIYVNEDVMPMTRVREHLARFGLEWTIGIWCMSVGVGGRDGTR